jgi:hypothetical protein
MHRLAAFIDSVASPNPPGTEAFFAYANAEKHNADIRTTSATYATANNCPKHLCTGQLFPLHIGGEAYRKGKADQPVANTSECDCEHHTDSDALFSHNAVMVARLVQFAVDSGIHENEYSRNALDTFRCLPPDPSKMLDPLHIVLFGLCLCDYQCHYASHTQSCFKITTRTPKGLVCRYLVPWLANALQSCIDKEHGKFMYSRPIGCEYYNICSLLWAQLSESNSDIQFLINSPGKDGKKTQYLCCEVCV